jgi:purine-nucleoside phosphorylase
VALDAGISLKEGVYAGTVGPSLETPSETRFLKLIGADAVGMSTVLEVIAGVHCGLEILVIVAITNVNLPDCMKKSSIEDIIKVASRAGKSLAVLWENILRSMP